MLNSRATSVGRRRPAKPGNVATRAVVGIVAIVGIALVCTFLTSCSSSKKTTVTGNGPTVPAPNSSTSSAADAAAITAAYEKFFNATTPPAEAETLLQDGTGFHDAIIAQSKAPSTQGATVTVSNVSVLSASRAAVTFTILVKGSPVLQNQGGWSVKEGGTWKVAGTTFCGLLAMAGTPPAACLTTEGTSLPQ